MSRRKQNDGSPRKVVVINLGGNPELAQAIDQRMVAFGLDSRHNTVLAMLEAHCSAYPIDAEIALVAQAAVRESRNAEYAALREFHENRAKLFGSGQ